MTTEESAPSSLSDLLVRLSSLKISMQVEGEQIHFRAPKGALTPELKSELVARKSEILAYLQSLQSDKEQKYTTITPRPHLGLLPLSFAQQRLWFIDQLEPGQGKYNIAGVFRLRGSIELATLERSLADIVRRHASLRTNYRMVDGNPMQIIQPASGCRPSKNGKRQPGAWMVASIRGEIRSRRASCAISTGTKKARRRWVNIRRKATVLMGV